MLNTYQKPFCCGQSGDVVNLIVSFDGEIRNVLEKACNPPRAFLMCTESK
jgi:hypothetical protein